MSERCYKYSGEHNDAGRLVCYAIGCKEEALTCSLDNPCSLNLCREHYSLVFSCPGGELRLKPKEPS